jgi:hypothetical protein
MTDDPFWPGDPLPPSKPNRWLAPNAFVVTCFTCDWRFVHIDEAQRDRWARVHATTFRTHDIERFHGTEETNALG